jgi:putative endonuclease
VLKRNPPLREGNRGGLAPLSTSWLSLTLKNATVRLAGAIDVLTPYTPKLMLVAMHNSYVYMMTGRSDVLYTGVTSALEQRVEQHKAKVLEGFTKRYNLTSLVYYEVHEDILTAIAREKQIKGWTRAKKIALIESMNPHWRDLSEDW